MQLPWRQAVDTDVVSTWRVGGKVGWAWCQWGVLELVLLSMVGTI